MGGGLAPTLYIPITYWYRIPNNAFLCPSQIGVMLYLHVQFEWVSWQLYKTVRGNQELRWKVEGGGVLLYHIDILL